jgi:hypothetical protein
MAETSRNIGLQQASLCSQLLKTKSGTRTAICNSAGNCPTVKPVVLWG